MPVILSGAKDLARRARRSFAPLRVTARTPLTGSLLSKCLPQWRYFSVLLLRAIQRADDSLHRSRFDIRIRCSAKKRRARGYLDLDIGYSTCLGSLLKRVLRIREHLKIGYIPLIECLYKSINRAVAMTGQFAHDTINGDAGCTCNSL